MSQVGARRLEPAAITGVMSREVANFRTFWKATTFSSVLEPIIYLLAFGVGLGATLIDGVGNLEYVEFVATGMVATAVIFSSAFPSMFGTFVKHRFQNTYDAILAAPVDVEELVTAEVLWISLRAGFYGCFPLIVAMFFGLDPAWGMLLVPLFAFTTAIGFSGFGIATAATVGKIDHFNYVTTLVITPLFLVAGHVLPDRPASTGGAGRSPGSTRSTTWWSSCAARRSGSSRWTSSTYGILVAFAIAMWRLGVNRMEKRLID